MATDRKVLTPRQYEHCCMSLNECGRMVGGWWKQAAAKEALRGKRTRPPGAMFFMEMELAALHEELRDGTYAHGGYRQFWIHDPK